MDFTALINDVSAKATEIANLNVQVTSLTGERDAVVADLNIAQTRIAELEAQMVGQVDLAALTSARDEAVAALSAVATTVLTKVGKLNEQLPTDVAGLQKVIDDNSAALVIAPNGRSQDAVTDLSVVAKPRVSSFRSPR